MEIDDGIGTAGDGGADRVLLAWGTRQLSPVARTSLAREGQQRRLEPGDPIAEISVRLGRGSVAGIVLGFAARGEAAGLALRAGVCLCVR